MNRKNICLFLALLLLLPASCLGEATIDVMQQYIPKITNVAGTHYVIMQSKEDSTYGLFTTACEEVIPCQYASLSYVSNLFFSAGNGSKDLNSKAILKNDGRLISDYAYGAIKAYSQRWVAGYVITQVDEADGYDLKISKKFYRIDRTDLFFVGDEAQDNYLVATFEGQPFAATYLHGDYITVQDAEEKLTVYNQEFKPMDFVPDNLKDSIYGVQDYQVVNLATGETVIPDYTAVKETSSASGTLLTVTRYHWTGKKISGVFDLNGSELVPVEYSISSVTPHYAVITNAEKLKGLYSVDEKKVIVPCMFTNILLGKNATDTYVMNGYVMVEKDGTRCYFDVSKGEVTCEINDDADALTRVGAVCYTKLEDGYMLIAADGVKTKADVDSIAGTRGDGFLLIAKKEGFFGVIDWHGNEVLPFIHKTAPVITDDSTAIIRTSTGMEIDQVVRK